MAEEKNKKILQKQPQKGSQPRPQVKGGGGAGCPALENNPLQLYDSQATSTSTTQYMDITSIYDMLEYYVDFQPVILNPDGNALTVGTSNFDQNLIDQVIGAWCNNNQEVCDEFEEAGGEWPVWEFGMKPGDIFPSWTTTPTNYPWENPTTINQYDFYNLIEFDQNAMLDNFCDWCWVENPLDASGATLLSPPNPSANLSIPGLIGMNTMYSTACLCCNANDYPNMPIYGCTDPAYVEYYLYEPPATDDDGSCETTAILGCNDPDAENYNEEANVNDGSCYYEAEQEDPPKTTDFKKVNCYKCKWTAQTGPSVIGQQFTILIEEECADIEEDGGGWTENEDEACPEEEMFPCYRCQNDQVVAMQFSTYEYPKGCPKEEGWTSNENPCSQGKLLCYRCEQVDTGTDEGIIDTVVAQYFNLTAEEGCPPPFTENEDEACFDKPTQDFLEFWEDEEINFESQEYTCAYCPPDDSVGSSGYYFLVSPQPQGEGNPYIGWNPSQDGEPPVPVPTYQLENSNFPGIWTPYSMNEPCSRFAPVGSTPLTNQFYSWDDGTTGPDSELHQFCINLGYPEVDDSTIGVDNSDSVAGGDPDEPYQGPINCVFCPGQQISSPELEQAIWDYADNNSSGNLGQVCDFDYSGFLNVGITNDTDMYTNDLCPGLSEFYIANFNTVNVGISQYSYGYGDFIDYLSTGFGLWGDPGQVYDNTQSSWDPLPGQDYMLELYYGYWYPESWTQPGSGIAWDVEVDGAFPEGMNIEGNPFQGLNKENCFNFVPYQGEGYEFDQWAFWSAPNNNPIAQTVTEVCAANGFNDALATQPGYANPEGITPENLTGIPTIDEGDCPWSAACNWGDPCPEGLEDECVNNCYWGCPEAQQRLAAIVGQYGYGPCADFISMGTTSTICCENCAVNEGECIIDTFNNAWSDIIVEQVIGDSYDALCVYGPGAVEATNQFADYIGNILNTAQDGLTFIPGVTTNQAILDFTDQALTTIDSVEEYVDMADQYTQMIMNNPAWGTWESLCEGTFNVTDFMASFLPYGSDIVVMAEGQDSLLYSLTYDPYGGGISDNFLLDLIDPLDGYDDDMFTVNVGPATMWQVVESVVCYMDATWWDQSNSFPGNTGYYHDCCGNVPGATTTEGNIYQNHYDSMWQMCVPGQIEIGFITWVANKGYDPTVLTLAEAEAGTWMEYHPYYTYGGNHPTYLNNVFGSTLGQSYTTDWGPYGGPGGWCVNGGAPDQYNIYSGQMNEQKSRKKSPLTNKPLDQLLKEDYSGVQNRKIKRLQNAFRKKLKKRG